ncbi:hypothetical protein Shyhy02_73340 [Streptomyces hygroscopicus subsp. hygroscopicus]|nr:hypothetical protein Shyhy02_73340 [Streptomyces hygroscopicus subsp. hygroscopicus]
MQGRPAARMRSWQTGATLLRLYAGRRSGQQVIAQLPWGARLFADGVQAATASVRHGTVQVGLPALLASPAYGEGGRGKERGFDEGDDSVGRSPPGVPAGRRRAPPGHHTAGQGTQDSTCSPCGAIAARDASSSSARRGDGLVADAEPACYA